MLIHHTLNLFIFSSNEVLMFFWCYQGENWKWKFRSWKISFHQNSPTISLGVLTVLLGVKARIIYVERLRESVEQNCVLFWFQSSPSVTLQSGCQSKSQNDDFEYFQVDFDKATFEFDWILESLPGTNLGSSQRVAKR